MQVATPGVERELMKWLSLDKTSTFRCISALDRQDCPALPRHIGFDPSGFAARRTCLTTDGIATDKAPSGTQPSRAKRGRSRRRTAPQAHPSCARATNESEEATPLPATQLVAYQQPGSAGTRALHELDFMDFMESYVVLKGFRESLVEEPPSGQFLIFYDF